MKLNTEQISSFLMYRSLNPCENTVMTKYFPKRTPVKDSFDLEEHLKNCIKNLGENRIALALSGGIDSAILAKYVPKDTIAYTFKCIVPGIEVTDETKTAKKYADECGLEHKIIEIYWEDFEEYAPLLMKHKKAPIHSIEVQIYKASLQAKKDGIGTIVFGEAADAIYGGLSGLLSKDWTIGAFIDRYSFLMPYKVLKNFELNFNPYKKWENDGKIDPHDFISHIFINESIGSYINAVEVAGQKLVLPYPETYMATEIDYGRIRSGENKYLIREIFERLYPGFLIPPKTPMPRPINEWLKAWKGPEREEFWENCVEDLTGDQKWLLWSLEKFLNLLEE